MSTDIRWSEIRPVNGSIEDGFEELCAQLARAESPREAEFFRTGEQDAGVECYCVLTGGDEWGWQAKFFTEPMRAPQLNQIDRSVLRALDEHPRLKRYFVCVPRNRSDGKRTGVVTELERYREREEQWRLWAAERGMEVEFVWWGTSELRALLDEREPVGWSDFWFGDQSRFGPDWFRQRLDDAIANVGARYTPAVHIDVSAARKLDLFAREPRALDRLRQQAKDIREALARSTRQAVHYAEIDEEGVFTKLAGLAEHTCKRLGLLHASPERELPIGSLITDIEQVMTWADRLAVALSERAAAREPDPESIEDTGRPRSNSYEEAETSIIRLQGLLGLALEQLQEAEPLVNGNVLILSGEAGIGKTHLLCDVARHRIDAGQPTVLLLGQRFLITGDPWVQAMQQLHLGAARPEQFLGALDIAAQAADAPALLVIDAINEGQGPALWPNHLGSFLGTIKRFPRISCIISVRSTYDDAVVPEHARTGAIEVTHAGFADRSYDAARAYFMHFGIDLPATPLLQPEFDNPLFLKLFCQRSQARGVNQVSRRHFSIGDLFDGLLEDVNGRLSRVDRLDFNPTDRLVQRALAYLAAHFVLRDSRWISQPDAAELIDSHLPRQGFSQSLYRALVSEGLLLEAPAAAADGAADKVVSLTFDRFADHLIAAYLIESHIDQDDPASAFRPDGRLAPLSEEHNFASRGVIEALCVQVPERFGTELGRLMPSLFDSQWGRTAFLNSLYWRRPEGCSEDTRRQFETLLANPDAPSPREVFDALLSLAAIPEHPLNASFMHELLRSWSLPDRDAQWSIYLHEAYAYREGGPVNRLLDWASELPGEARDSLADDVVDSIATAFAWMLTASNRFVRDRATKALVWLMTGRIDSLVRLLERFAGIDDPYVAERVHAAAYGVATRCHDSDEIAPLARVVYQSVFADGQPPSHVLLRDYARGVIERALYLGAQLELDEALIRPPYGSQWPHIPSADELALLAPRPEISDAGPYDPRRAENAIHFSVMDWDFAKYIIGADGVRGPWLRRRLSEARWRSPDELQAELEEEISDAAAEAMSEYRARKDEHALQSMYVSPRNFLLLPPFNRDDESSKSGDETDALSSALVSEEELAASQARVDRSRAALLDALSDEQRERLRTIESTPAREPRVDPELIQRYVLARVFDLGWSNERFGQFDSLVGERQFRASNKAERIGKKYQWIAYHEMLAFLSDHHQFDTGYSDDRSRFRFNGPWQVNRRDIDPTAATRARPRSAAGMREERVWWRGYEFEDWRADESAREWLNVRLDDRAPKQLIRVADPADGLKWINLRAQCSWNDPSPADAKEEAKNKRRVWIHADAYLVALDRVAELVRWAENVDFMGRWMPEPRPEYESFLGEHGWSPAFLDHFDVAAEAPVHTQPDSPECPTSVYLTAAEYVSEANGYDCSLERTHTFLVPQQSLIDGLGLRWLGSDADFCDASGRLAAFASDPAGSDASLMVRDDLMRRYLDRERLALVWAVVGEKEMIGGARGWDWLGSHQFTGAYRFRDDDRGGDELTGGLSHQLHFPDSPPQSSSEPSA